MNTEFFTFGEILWDCLPSGRHAGGAPFNVAAHLAQLGVSVSLISAVGQDSLGDEILEVAKNKGVNVEFVGRVRIGLPTGTVIATVDAMGNATYELVQPVAWDEIIVSAEALEAVAKADAFIFGSLATRSPYNLEQLDRLLSLKGPLKFFDVNLRPPFADPKRIVELVARADVIKLNHDEVGQIASWLRTGEATPNPPGNAEAVAEACAVLAEATKTPRICVTMAAAGAALWDRGNLVSAAAPKVVVKDTVGAGDAFMAGLMVGLTRGADTQTVLETACRLGAIVASHDGATPLLPQELIQEFRVKLKADEPSAKSRSA
jgi:fructokinase